MMIWTPKLLPQQREALDFLLRTIKGGGGAALFSEQRTGKTFVTLAFLEQVVLDTILIVSPLTGIEVTWREKLSQTPALKNHFLTSDWEEFKSHRGEPRILLVHFQLFTKLSKRLEKQSWDLAVIDESQGLRDRSSKQSRAARRCRNAARRLALSGTPIDESPIELFAQMRMVDHTVLGEDWRDFADVYCRKAGFMNKEWIFKKHLLPKLLKVLEPRIFRLSMDEMGIARPRFHLVTVPLLGRQAAIYRDMETHGLVDIDDRIVKADLPVIKKLRLEQITGGFVGDDGDTIEVGRAKQRKFQWLIKRIKLPMVISCKFLWEIESLIPILEARWRTRKLTGEIKDDKRGNERTRLLKDFQAGKIDALAVQVRTGGVSVDFSKAASLVIFSMNHSAIDFSQLVARLRNIGQKRAAEVYVLLAENTVDEQIRSIVQDKVRDAIQVVSHFEKGKIR